MFSTLLCLDYKSNKKRLQIIIKILRKEKRYIYSISIKMFNNIHDKYVFRSIILIVRIFSYLSLKLNIIKHLNFCKEFTKLMNKIKMKDRNHNTIQSNRTTLEFKLQVINGKVVYS